MGKTMLIIGQFEGWENYMPELIHHAKTTHSVVHVLGFAAPLGMGLFTSNMPSEVEGDPALMPADTAEAARNAGAFLESVARFLRSSDLEVTTTWLPEYPVEQMGDYARANGVDTVAVIPRSWWATLIDGDARPHLKDRGLTVIELGLSDSSDRMIEPERPSRNIVPRTRVRASK